MTVDSWGPGWEPLKPTADLDRVYMEARKAPELEPVLPPDDAAKKIVSSLIGDLPPERQEAVRAAIEQAMTKWGEELVDSRLSLYDYDDRDWD